jgi:hypothetical protein
MVAPLKSADYECCLILGGLYLQKEAKKRRIWKITVESVPKWARAAFPGAFAGLHNMR